MLDYFYPEKKICGIDFILIYLYSFSFPLFWVQLTLLIFSNFQMSLASYVEGNNNSLLQYTYLIKINFILNYIRIRVKYKEAPWIIYNQLQDEGSRKQSYHTNQSGRHIHHRRRGRPLLCGNGFHENSILYIYKRMTGDQPIGPKRTTVLPLYCYTKVIQRAERT